MAACRTEAFRRDNFVSNTAYRVYSKLYGYDQYNDIQDVENETTHVAVSVSLAGGINFIIDNNASGLRDVAGNYIYADPFGHFAPLQEKYAILNELNAKIGFYANSILKASETDYCNLDAYNNLEKLKAKNIMRVHNNLVSFRKASADMTNEKFLYEFKKLMDKYLSQEYLDYYKDFGSSIISFLMALYMNNFKSRFNGTNLINEYVGILSPEIIKNVTNCFVKYKDHYKDKSIFNKFFVDDLGTTWYVLRGFKFRAFVEPILEAFPGIGKPIE